MQGPRPSHVLRRSLMLPAVMATFGVIAAFTALPDVGEPDGVGAPTQDRMAQVQRGRALVLEHGCGGCHGGFDNPAADGWLAGVMSPAQEFIIGPCLLDPEATPCFRTRPRNLTPDNTTGLGRFSERQIFNALRYGLRPGETADVEITSSTPGQGNFPMFPKFLAPPMPWPAWRHMPDEDLWAIAAYLKEGLRPVSNQVEDSEGPPDFWVSEYGSGTYGTYPIQPFPTANEVEPAAGVDRDQVLRGRHLTVEHACGDCHGGFANPAAEGFLNGVTGPIMEFPIGPCLVDPAAPCWTMRPRNLTPDATTGIGRYTDQQLFNVIRYGLRPSADTDRALQPSDIPADPDRVAPGMPWIELRHMSDADIRAIIAYLRHGLKPVVNEVADSDRPDEGWAAGYAELNPGSHPAAPFPTAKEVAPGR